MNCIFQPCYISKFISEALHIAYINQIHRCQHTVPYNSVCTNYTTLHYKRTTSTKKFPIIAHIAIFFPYTDNRLLYDSRALESAQINQLAMFLAERLIRNSQSQGK